MRVEYINPFVESAHSILKEVLGGEVRRGDLYLKSTSMPVMGVATLVGLAGDVEGRVLFDMSFDTALKIASQMNMEELKEFDELAKATITELANMITAVLPTITSCLSEAWGEINFLKISIENIVEAALSIAASELTTAPSRAAKMKPLRPKPEGRTFVMSSPKAESNL